MIKEILVKTALSPSRLPGLDYALNPYRDVNMPAFIAMRRRSFTGIREDGASLWRQK